MPNTESSFADRLQRAQQLKAALPTFTPAYSPADERLGTAEFGDFLDEVAALNTRVHDMETAWRDGAAARQELVKDIKARALRVLARVKSHVAWTRQLPPVKSAADALRGYRTPAPKPPPDQPPAGRRNPATDLSFADIKNLLDKLIAALNRVPNYDTGSPVDLTLATLNSLATVLDGQNRVMAGLEQGLAAARAPRLAAYESEDVSAPGLRVRMKAIKESVKSQYGSASAEYAQVKGIRV